MKKRTSITLLSVIGFLMVVLVFLTFVKFPVGVKVYNSILGAIDWDYDVEGGYAYDLTFSDENENEAEDKDALEQDVVTRLHALGYQVFSVKRIVSPDKSIDDYKIRIELKGDSNTGSDITAVAMYGKLRILGGSDSSNLSEILTDVKAIDKVDYIGARSHEGTVYQNFSIKFTDEAKEFLNKEVSGNYYIKIMAGDEEGDYSTTILDTTSGSEAFSIKDAYSNGVLTLSYGSDENVLKRMIMQLNYGGLDYKFKVGDGARITSLYGENISTISLVVILVILLGIIGYFAFTNRGFSIVIALCLILFVVDYLSMFILVPNIVLSLGSVLGIIMAVCLVADGFIILTKRISEEFLSGKTVKAAVRFGYRRAFLPTLASHVVALVVALALLFTTTGIVNGFAIAFGIGVGVSFFTTILFTRMFTSLILPLIPLDKQEGFFKLRREDK